LWYQLLAVTQCLGLCDVTAHGQKESKSGKKNKIVCLRGEFDFDLVW
jgi:hypothetical protein